MPDVTSDHFFSLLQQSNLLAVERLESVRADFAIASDQQLLQLIEQLIGRGWLTRWQAKMLLAGQHAFFLGKYKLLDHLGQGGMGSVFKAEQLPLGRMVAIKVIAKRCVQEPGAIARFQREIRASAALSHPNVVSVYDADCIDGRHLLVMEYVAGRDLSAAVKVARQLPVGEACEYVRQAALGLQHAHECGLIHRDIKPGNLLLACQPGGLPVVKILDMGLARFDEDTGDTGELTQSGQIMGTPDYIAPEQAQDSRHADIRSDIYSLGCTLFRCLSGEVPFVRTTLMTRLMARMTAEPPQLRNVLPAISPELNTIVLKMMARYPDDRYQTPLEVANALAPFADVSAASVLAAKLPGGPQLHEETIAFEPQQEIEPGLNDFLQNLATEAARDEEIDASTQSLAQTVALGEPNASVSADRATPQTASHGQQTARGAQEAPQITRAGRKLKENIAARNRADRRRLLLVLAAIAAFIGIAIGMTQWHRAGETHLVIDWPIDERAGAVIKIDGVKWELGKVAQLSFPGRPGRRTMYATRKGYIPIKQDWDFQRGQRIEFQLDWQPTPETARTQQLASLTRRVDAWVNVGHSPDDQTVVKLCNDLVDFGRVYPGTDASIIAAKHMKRLPWPVDLLKQSEIDAYKLKIAGNGDAANALPELVAILGESRLKHPTAVDSIAFSPDGGLLAASAHYSPIRLWNTRTGELERVLPTTPNACRLMAFAPDGRTLAAYSPAGHRGVIYILKADSGEELTTIDISMTSKIAEEVGIRAKRLAFSPGGRRLAISVHGFGTVIYNPATGDELASIVEEDFVTFTPDGSSMVLSSGDDTIRLRDVETQKVVTEWKASFDAAVSGADGRVVATVSRQQMKLWDSTSGRELQTIPMNLLSKSTVLAFHPQKSILAVGDVNGTISLWHGDAATPVRRIEAYSYHVRHLSFSPDGNSLASVGQFGNAVRLWDVATGEEINKAAATSGSATSVAVSPDGRRIASGSDDQKVTIWDLETGREVLKLEGHIHPVHSVAFSPDGKQIASAGGTYTMPGEVKVWNAVTGELLHTIMGHQDLIDRVVFGPGGNRICTASPEGTVILWDAETGQKALKLKGRALAFNPNGKTLATGSQDGDVWIWDAVTGRKIRTLEGHKDYVLSLAFSRDGKWLVSASADQTMKIWQAGLDREWANLPGHSSNNSAAHDLEIRPDGRLIASLGRNGSVRLWDLDKKHDSLRKIFRFNKGVGAHHEVAFTPDGRHVVVANGNGTLWVLRLEEWSAMGSE